jgi:PST family polysaccharide transporter
LSTIYLKKLGLRNIKLSAVVFKEESKDMIRLGVSMMFVSLLVALSAFILRAYITKINGIEDVGYFQAGFQIVSGYFGMIFSTLTLDLFPRLSAINKDDIKLEKEMNRQIIVGLVLLLPLIVVLIFFMPFLVTVLYSSDFLSSVDYVRYAIFGVIFFLPGQAL